MGVFARPAGLRRGLVALLLLGLAGWAFPQARSDAEPGTEAALSRELTLIGAPEVLASRCSRIHGEPLYLLFLLPGVAFLVFAGAVSGRRGFPVLLVAGLLAGGLAAGGLLTAVLWEGRKAGASAAGEAAADPVPVEQLLEAAEQESAAGKWGEALALYREAGGRLGCNPALEHNLGVCYAGSGETGLAVHHLRRSLQARPGSQVTRRALAALEKRAGLQGQLPMPVPVEPDALFVVTLALANLGLGAAGFALRRGGVRALILMILFAIGAATSLGFFLGLLYDERRPVGVVVAEGVGLMKIPEPEARAGFLLPPGTSVRIRGQAGEYYLVETASEFRGWVGTAAIVLD
ncbi:MAG: hypothetical protein JW820_03485 [Spirochaetales bacterium]|nr:hypothetical protein [Spirochaetales bacterium]